MTTLDKLRDALALEHCNHPSERVLKYLFVKGFDAAIKALSEGVEFDISHARSELDAREERVGPEMLEDDPDRFLCGAEWQHSQDAARIGHAHEMRDNAFRACLATNDKLAAAEAENARLRGALERVAEQKCDLPFIEQAREALK